MKLGQVNLQSYPTTSAAKSAPASQPAEEGVSVQDTVTFDKKTKTYHFPDRDRTLRSPLAEGLTAAALIGIPSAVGAAETMWMGREESLIFNIAVSRQTGPVIGAAALGYGAAKMSDNSLGFTVLGGLAGLGVGLFAWPLLKLPGVLGGPVGAAAAAGAAGAGVAIWAAVSNKKVHEQAAEMGYKG